jgi:MFS family permease
MMGSALILLLALTTIIYLSPGEIIMAICFIGLGVGASGCSIGFAIMAEQCKEEYLGLGLALNNAIISMFGALNAPLIGGILYHLELAQPGQLSHYKSAFLVMIVLNIIGIIMVTLFVKETFCKLTRVNTILNTQTSSLEDMDVVLSR